MDIGVFHISKKISNFIKSQFFPLFGQKNTISVKNSKFALFLLAQRALSF